MATVEETTIPLRMGDNLRRDEFLRRWEAMPELKRAELIGGVVYMSSPLSKDHSKGDFRIATWSGVYVAQTPGCEGGQNATWLMGTDAPQPDVYLQLLPEFGGQAFDDGHYLKGTPEWIAEICLSSVAYDLHQKLDLYERAGVREYLAVLLHEQEIRWHRLVNGEFEIMPPGDDGIHRSQVFPGLWLDGAALFAGKMDRVLAVLAEGMQSPEYQLFVEELSKSGSSSSP